MADRSACTYRLDASDTIVAYGGAWLAFARANRAPELEGVVGHSIWGYVSGRTTRALYAVVFDRVRARRKPVTLPFRCDSPTLFRFMELDIEPGAEGALALAGRLLRVQQRPYLPILDHLATRSSATLQMCSVCKRTRLQGAQWMEVETAVERLGLFASLWPPRLAYTVCDDCFQRVEVHP